MAQTAQRSEALIDLQTLEGVGVDCGTVSFSEGGVTISAGAGTDAFSPPDGGPAIDRLPGLRLPVPEGDWRVVARVAPMFRTTFDAAALVVRSDAGAWAKLAYERSPDGRGTAVSVVTRATSDDANGPTFDLAALWLRVAHTGKVVAFHTSTDGVRWDLLRLFALPGRVQAVDLIAQSPMGEGCSARIDEVALLAGCPADMRDGS
jgi:regulation of enolase protein 1 (concanavalin A-like superfamily)